MFEIIGHRGAGVLAPENTLEGFKKAFELGCLRVEFDVHLTKDGKCAVIHHPFLDTTTSGAGLVSAYTMEEIKKFDAGRGTKVPELSEVFSLFQGSDYKFQIELKGEGTEAPVAALVEAFSMNKKVRFTSFVHRRVYRILKRVQGAEGGLLMSSLVMNPVTLLDESGAGYLHLSKWNIEQGLPEMLHEHGKKLIAWENIITEEDFERLLVLNADGATTDRPDLFIEYLKKHQTGS